MIRTSTKNPQVPKVLLVQDHTEAKHMLICKISDDASSYECEIKVLRTLMHTGVVTKLQVTFPPQAFLIEAGMPFLEYYEKAKKPIPKTRLMDWVREVGIALGQMHHLQICHNDFKATQVVLLGELHDHFRLIDMDNARCVGEMLPSGYTPMFAAPEVIRAHVCGTAATTPCTVKHDIWSFGMFAYWLLSGGTHLFTSPEEAQCFLCDSPDSLSESFNLTSRYFFFVTL
jgi:serine/threonine protein kinase